MSRPIAALLALSLAAGCGATAATPAQDAGAPLAPEPDASSASCALAGAGAVTLATLSSPALAIASDGTELFWLDTFAPGSPATLRAVPVGGGAPRVVATFSLWNAWVGYCDVTYPDGGVDPGGGTDSSCDTFSLAVDDANVYAVGPVGVVAAPKAGGAARALVTLGVPNDFVLGSAVMSGGALVWVQDHVPDDPDASETVTIERLDLQSGAVTTLVTEPPSGATDSALAADGDSVYWGFGAAIRATALVGGATTTVLSSSSLNPGPLALAGDRVVWVNQQVTGGTCGECGPPPTPEPEMVQLAPTVGGTATTLLTFPLSTDPYLSLLGDSSFVYVVTTPLSVGPASSSTLQAFPVGGGSPTSLLDGVPVQLLASDACSLYVTSGNALERVAKPSP